mgnify:CR=1 FL=1
MARSVRPDDGLRRRRRRLDIGAEIMQRQGGIVSEIYGWMTCGLDRGGNDVYPGLSDRAATTDIGLQTAWVIPYR